MNHTRPLKRFEFGNHSHVGLRRQQNEDYMGYFDTPNGHLFIVADGMGGHVGGATASQLAVVTIRDFFQREHYTHVPDALQRAVVDANLAILQKASLQPELAGMGTTVVVVLVREGELWYAHVGDSRIYRFANGKLERLTRDHSFVQTLVDQGLITDEQAEEHPRKNELMQALGVGPSIKVDVSHEPLRPQHDEYFLLCSDGLNGYTSEQNIAMILDSGLTIREKAIKLVEAANDGGGGDNITVQVLRFFDHARLQNPLQAGTNPHSKPNLSQAGRSGTSNSLKYALVVIVALGVGIGSYFAFFRGGTPAPPAPADRDSSLTSQADPEPEPVPSPYAGGHRAIIKLKTTTRADSFANWLAIPMDSLLNPATQARAPLELQGGTNVSVLVDSVYIVTPGMVLDSISVRFGIEKERLKRINQLNINRVLRGDTILIPFRSISR